MAQSHLSKTRSAAPAFGDSNEISWPFPGDAWAGTKSDNLAFCASSHSIGFSRANRAGFLRVPRGLFIFQQAQSELLVSVGKRTIKMTNYTSSWIDLLECNWQSLARFLIKMLQGK
jgi:hypothetical protein